MKVYDVAALCIHHGAYWTPFRNNDHKWTGVHKRGHLAISAGDFCTETWIFLENY